MLDRKYLERCLKSHNIFYYFYSFDEETVTARQASKLLNVPLSSIAKSILFLDENKNPLLVVLPGYKRIPQRRLARMLGKKKLRLARREEVLEVSGYVAGGIPPLCHKKLIETIIDRECLDQEYIVVGGGDIHSLLKIKPEDLVKIQKAKIIEL